MQSAQRRGGNLQCCGKFLFSPGTARARPSEDGRYVTAKSRFIAEDAMAKRSSLRELFEAQGKPAPVVYAVDKLQSVSVFVWCVCYGARDSAVHFHFVLAVPGGAFAG